MCVKPDERLLEFFEVWSCAPQGSANSRPNIKHAAVLKVKATDPVDCYRDKKVNFHLQSETSLLRHGVR